MKLLSPHTLTIGKLRKSLIISFCITLAFVLVDALQEWKVPQLYLKATITSSVDANAQVYFDIGNGLHEKDSAKCMVEKRWKFQVLKFPLPWKPIRYIRFDPLNAPGKIALKEIKLVDEFDRLIQAIDLHALKPFHQIRSIGVENDLLVVSTDTNANDPMLYLNLQYPIKYTYNLKDCIIQNLSHIPKKAVIVFLLSWTAMLFAYFEKD